MEQKIYVIYNDETGIIEDSYVSDDFKKVEKLLLEGQKIKLFPFMCCAAKGQNINMYSEKGICMSDIEAVRKGYIIDETTLKNIENNKYGNLIVSLENYKEDSTESHECCKSCENELHDIHNCMRKNNIKSQHIHEGLDEYRKKKKIEKEDIEKEEKKTDDTNKMHERMKKYNESEVVIKLNEINNAYYVMREEFIDADIDDNQIEKERIRPLLKVLKQEIKEFETKHKQYIDENKI